MISHTLRSSPGLVATRSAFTSCSAFPLSHNLFHTSRKASKNPYYFYDLVSKQPRTSFDPAQFSFNHSELSTADRVKLVFGQLGSRQAARHKNGFIKIAGVKLSSRPEEPNNCCMSGCIDCVWELYKDELIEWKKTRNEVKQLLMEPSRLHIDWPEDLLGPEPSSRQAMAAGNASSPDHTKQMAESVSFEDDDDDLNVSIKAFLKTEKKLKEKRKLLLQQQQQQQQQVSI